MTLGPGTRLGSYEILSPLGAGGMGEVYRARDTKLGRDVAVKVLPESFSQNEERLARFGREARLLASLNHPGIATIHGLEESNGVHYLVMELVPGETLAERISPRPMPIDETLPLFQQIAEALEAAHENGIIHRDLKPANIKITPDSKAKVLDFGLAKALTDKTTPQNVSESPTITRDATETGVLLGTAPYMSPEQARGKPVDKRTDIWAFGCCLYEALTGKPAFLGDTVSDTLVAVLEREPEWEALAPETPTTIRNLLRRCLRKEAQRRLHDMADARIEIEEALTEPWKESEVSKVVGTKRRFGIVPILVSTLVAALLGGLAVWGFLRGSNPDSSHTSSFVIEVAEPLGVGTPGRRLCLSPDGRRLVYVVGSPPGSRLYLRNMDELDARPIPGTEGAHHPFFSPDSEWLGFFAEGKLKKISLATETQLTLCDAGAEPRGASWGSDDSIIFAAPASGLFRVSADGGTPQAVTTCEPGDPTHRWPEVLPGGKGVLFTTWIGALEEASIAVLSLETGQSRILVENGTNPLYVPTGHVAYARGGSLQTVPFDSANLDKTGPPVTALDNVRVYGGGAADFSISDDGSLVYQPFTPEELDLVWVDRGGSVSPLSVTRRAFDAPRLSADGRFLAVMVDDLQHDLWILEIARGTLTRLTFGLDNHDPMWTPDGRRIAFSSSRLGPRNLFWKPADGSGVAERLATSQHTQNPGAWASDGKAFAFEELRPDSGFDILIVELDGELQQTPFLVTEFNERHPAFSPDGRWLAYTSDETGLDEVYVRSFPGSGSKRQISTEGGVDPVWNPSGGELFYRSGDQIMAVAVETEPDLSPSRPRLLFQGSYKWTAYYGIRNYDVAPDGERFVMIVAPPDSAKPAKLHVILNWAEELKRSVPTN
jgi:serine/threonine-protein kinase